MDNSQRVIELEAALRQAQNALKIAQTEIIELKKENAALKGVPYEESKAEAIGLITPTNDDKKNLI